MVFLSYALSATSTHHPSHHRPTFFAKSLPLAERARAVQLHRMAVLRLQEEKDDEELCQISQRLSSLGSARAHTLAKAWIVMDN